MQLKSVPLHTTELDRLEPVIGHERMRSLRSKRDEIWDSLSGRALINVNSTAKGGGVAEMLNWILGYVRGAGIDVKWYVIEGPPEFFDVTKRLHNMLHGSSTGSLTGEAEEVFRQVSARNAEELRPLVSPGDIIVLHDPQTAGLAPAMKDAGAVVVWRCHVGTEHESEAREEAWRFLRPFLQDADATVFSRRQCVPDWVEENRLAIIPPSIDPFTTKNRPMSDEAALAILQHVGILQGAPGGVRPEYTTSDGSTARVNRMADIVRTGPAPGPETKLVVQVSRWDRLKDMQGVMEAFAAYVDGDKQSQLVLAGPVVTGVADDPEGGEVLTECIEAWRNLPHIERSRVQLVCIPMTDVNENAAIVNALQTHAALVVQKSLEEGFGLTVTEAMWKGKPVVASAIGGIRDQIVDGESGILLQDPRDHREFADAVQSVLDDEQFAQVLGKNAKARVAEHFLGDRQLLQYLDLLKKLGVGS